MLSKPAIGAPCNGCGLCCKATVCGAGSVLMGLVKEFGQRAPGPCPALLQEGDGYTCGIMNRPHNYLLSQRGPTVLRKAVGVLIGAGSGCDDAGDEPAVTARPKLIAMQEEYIAEVGTEAINKAWETVLEH